MKNDFAFWSPIRGRADRARLGRLENIRPGKARIFFKAMSKAI